MSDWQEEMSVGVQAIDAYHRQLLRRIRHLAGAVSAGDAADVRSSLRLLQSYLAEHRADEERWMEDAGYPGAREHARAHATVLDRIAEASGDDRAGAEKRLLVAAEAVARALDLHMRSDDLKVGRFVTARENLRKLAEEGPGVGMALTPIPGTVAAWAARPRRGDDEPAATPAPLPPGDR